jgi:hypothetical protein
MLRSIHRTIILLCLSASCGTVIVEPEVGPTRTDVMAASGRAQGGGFTLDFQVGHAPVHGPHGNAAVELETAAPVAP